MLAPQAQLLPGELRFKTLMVPLAPCNTSPAQKSSHLSFSLIPLQSPECLYLPNSNIFSCLSCDISMRFHFPGSLSPWRPTPSPPTISLWFLVPSVFPTDRSTRTSSVLPLFLSTGQSAPVSFNPQDAPNFPEPLPLMLWDPDSRRDPFRPCGMSSCGLGVCFRERKRRRTGELQRAIGLRRTRKGRVFT